MCNFCSAEMLCSDSGAGMAACVRLYKKIYPHGTLRINSTPQDFTFPMQQLQTDQCELNGLLNCQSSTGISQLSGPGLCSALPILFQNKDSA